MKAPASWEFEGFDDDLSSGGLDGKHALLEIFRVKNHQRPARGSVGIETESADFSLAISALDSGVLWSVVRKLPAEGGFIETLRSLHIADGDFDVVDRVVLVHSRAGWLGPIRRKPGMEVIVGEGQGTFLPHFIPAKASVANLVI